MLRKSEIFIEDLGFQALSLIMNYRVVKYFQNRSLILLMHDCNDQLFSSLLPDRYGFVTFASEKDVHNVTEMVRYFRVIVSKDSKNVRA